MSRKILVTAALPYANGPIHIGHLVEYVQTDIWVRFQRLRGHRVIFLCADDTHGTAIMKSARDRGITEEAFIDEMRTLHLRDFHEFQVEFDHYGSTHCAENRVLCEEIWQALGSQSLVARRPVAELFDPVSGESLPDRFVKGHCPKCKSPDQYGDNCDKCGATYSAVDLIDPVSVLSGQPPVSGERDHYFVRIEALHDFLEEWTQRGDHLQSEVANYLRGHFLNEPLRDWDVSRPAPYFGFEIPGTDGQHFWYVWFDAPIGYIAATAQWCQKHGESLDDWWRADDVEIHHFIGKDIQYFHCLFWPAMLRAAGFRLPRKVHIHGFLTVGGEKMSKSKGTFIRAATYLRHLDPAYLRYYYASKLGPRVDDLDLSLDEFVAKVNADLVNKVVNLASRSAKFAAETGLSPIYPDDGGLFAGGVAAGGEIAEAYEECDYSRAMRRIMELADHANAYFDHHAPWKLAKQPGDRERLRDCVTVTLNLYRQIVIYLAPVMPRLAAQTGEFLQHPIEHWSDASKPLVGSSVASFAHLLARVDKEKVLAMIEETKEGQGAATKQPLVGTSAAVETPEPAATDPFETEPLAEMITIDDFAKVDLRVAEVLTAEHVPEAKKLLKITVSLGGNHRRTVFAGIKEAYDPNQLVGRKVIVVANLAPRQMKFGLSEGMIVASGGGGKEVYLLGVDSGARPGQRVH